MGQKIGNAVWEGSALAGVLEMAGVRPEAIELKVEAAGGFSSSVPLELAMHPRSLLVYHMNGEPLPVEHGFPPQVFYPGPGLLPPGRDVPGWQQRHSRHRGQGEIVELSPTGPFVPGAFL